MKPPEEWRAIRRATWRLALGATAVVGVYACSERTTPAAPNSVQPVQPVHDNVARACQGAVNPVGAHLPKLANGRALTPDTATLTMNGWTRLFVIDAQQVPRETHLVGVIGPQYGTFLALPASGHVEYTAPATCFGADTGWYILETPTGVRDTGLLVFRVIHPVIGKPDSLDVITDERLTRSSYLTINDFLPFDWSNPHVVGFAGHPRGAGSLVSDARQYAYTAPATSTGVDSAFVIYEATFHGVLIRDTTLVRFNVLARQPAPGPYDVVPIVASAADAATITLVPAGLSGNGKVTGTARLASGETRAFRWEAGRYTDLGLYHGSSTAGADINARGDVAGSVRTTDSTSLALVWKADGSILELTPGTSSSITDGDTVLVTSNYDSRISYNGAFIRMLPELPEFRTKSGKTLLCFPSIYQDCGLYFPDGTEAVVNLGHGTYPVVMNDSADIWLYGSGGAGDFDVFVERVMPQGALHLRSLNSVFPELLPPDLPASLGPQHSVAMDTRRNLLESNVLATARGAFLLDACLVDQSWHVVTTVALNDRGQILAVGSNSVTGLTTPILLTPRGNAGNP